MLIDAPSLLATPEPAMPSGPDQVVLPEHDPGGAALTVSRFGHLLGTIYDTAQDSQRWSACLEQIRREFGGNYSSLIVRRPAGSDLGYIISAAGPLGEMKGHNPLAAMSPFSCLRPEKVVTIGDLMSPAEWRASSYYREWCEPLGVFHVIAVDIEIRGVGIYGLRITRPPEAMPFGAAEQALCAQLVPHMRRALGLYAAANHDRQVDSMYRHAMGQLMVGVFVLDENGVVLERNTMANAILAQQDGIAVSSQKLCATYHGENRKLYQMIQKVLSQQAPGRTAMVEAMSLKRPSGRVPWSLVAQPIHATEWTEGRNRPSVALFLRDPEGKSEPPARLAQQLFQLTPAETALALQLANGLSLDEASEQLGIRRNTARAHLRSIFSKTGVRRQTELVRIFLNSVALLGNQE